MFLLSLLQFSLCLYKGAVLVIVDGMGESAWPEGNGISEANLPTFDYLKQQHHYDSLVAAQQPVGLISSERGSSAVGHQTLGLGRTTPSYLSLLERSMDSKKKSYLGNNTLLRGSMRSAKSNGKNVHVAGLCSDTGIISHIKYLKPIFRAAVEENITTIQLHCFLHGLKRKPSHFIRQIEEMAPENLNVRLASVHSGYTSMDKSKKWGRTAQSLNSFINESAQGLTLDALKDQADKLYEKGNKFMPLMREPTKDSVIRENDMVILFNHREDFSFQMADALAYGVKNHPMPPKINLVPLILYGMSLKGIPCIFPAPVHANGIGEWISKLGYKQLRVAEEYKRYHVTTFFSGGVLQPLFTGEDREVSYESRNAGTFDLHPEMNASLVTKSVIEGIKSSNYKLIVVNYANIDATGHFGNTTSVKLAAEIIDKHLNQILIECKRSGYALFVTADHGNGEENIDANGLPMIDHTVNNVPFMAVADGFDFRKMRTGSRPYIGNVAPTILEVLGLPIPSEMDVSLLMKSSTKIEFKPIHTVASLGVIAILAWKLLNRPRFGRKARPGIL